MHRRHPALITDHHSAGTTSTSSAGANHPHQVIDTEILLVNVVCHSQQGQTTILLKEVQARTDVIQVIESVTGIKTAKLSMINPSVCHHIDRLVALAIVDSTELGLIALLIQNLDLIDHLSRQVTDRRRHIISEELLPVDQQLLHLLALGLYGTSIDLYTRHFREQLFGRRVLSHLESSCIID